MEGSDPHGGHGQVCHPPSYRLRLFSSQTFSHINTPTFLKPSHTSYLPAYEDGTECSETSAYKIRTPGNYPEQIIRQDMIMSCKVHCPPHAQDTTCRTRTHATTPSAATQSTPTHQAHPQCNQECLRQPSLHTYPENQQVGQWDGSNSKTSNMCHYFTQVRPEPRW